MRFPRGLKKLPMISCGLLVLAAGGSPFSALGASIDNSTSATLDSTSYLGSANASQESLLSILQLNWRGAKRGKVLEAVGQAEAVLTLNNDSYRTLELPEAYLQTSSTLGPVQFSVGRRIEKWNHLDDAWKLGIWQPMFRWDFLNPENVGLTGAYLTVTQPGFRLVAFGSPIFIPDRGSPLQLRDGSFSSNLPWAIVPPAQAKVINKNVPVRYDIQAPPADEVINHPGAAIMARIGKDRGFWASAGYAYKPVNQLLLSYDAYLYLPAEGDHYSLVYLYPRVVYHHVGSVEAGFNGSLIEGWMSLLTEDPVMDHSPSNWVAQQLNKSYAVSSQVDFIVSGDGLDSARLSFAYLKQWGGNAPDLGPPELISPGVSTFEARYPFQETIKFGVKTSLPGELGGRFSLRSHVLYDLHNQGTILSAGMNVRLNRSWTLLLAADLLGSAREQNGGGPSDFISRYRANDRVHGGVTYVF